MILDPEGIPGIGLEYSEAATDIGSCFQSGVAG
jgi:hypothetical protein